MRRLIPAFALLLAMPAYAIPQAATYKDSAGQTREAQGYFCVPALDGSGCAAGSGGGGGAATIADGADVTQGAKADTAWTAGAGSVISILKAIANANVAALPAGTNIIGKVGIDQTTPGTTDSVTVKNAIARDTAGAAISPIAGTSNRIVTKTSLSANTSTTVCPAQTSPAPVTTEVIATAGSLGLGVNGQTLTTATVGTSTSAPDVPMPSANTYYLFPVAPTNAITAYSGTAQVVTCIQTTRQ